MPVLASLQHEIVRLKAELAKFGVVGGIGAIIDLGGSAYLYGHLHVEALAAKAISIAVATVVTYLGSRFWTFRHRATDNVGRETSMFIILNVVGLAIAEIVIAATSYGLGLKGHLAYDAASVIGTGLGTIFRYFSYKKWVFLAPETALAPEEAAAAAAVAMPASPSHERHPADQTKQVDGYYGPAHEHLDPADKPLS
jgi:putative flippase GtrA